MKSMRTFFAVLATGISVLSAAQENLVDLKRLLPQMTDLTFVTRRPSPSFSAAQASSYDRNAKTPGNEMWFANGDAGKFLREEAKAGRIEYVMADLQGPGAVTRIWSANPNGVIRFYFDGETEARFAWKMAELLGGKIPPLADPLSYFSSRGANLYFPIPYAKALKVTVDNSLGDGVKGLYYHVGYRTYAPTANVVSLTAKDLEDCAADIGRIVRDFRGKQTNEAPGGSKRIANELKAIWLEQPLLTETGPGAIYALRFRFNHGEPIAGVEDLPWDDPRQLRSVLRRVRLIADFDGERCVDVPISDFFASPAGGVPFVTRPIEVTEDGWMICRFVMPYGKSARVMLNAMGGPRLDVEFEAMVGPYRWDDTSYHFKTQWLGDHLRTRPMRDMEFLAAKGEGLFVGTSLHVANPVGAWWGEGDEKVYVDNETFPSTFGTGTEDYYGYAWCDPTPFTRPYHAQPRCDGPGNRGHTSVLRWQTFDAIPYRGSFRFDMELWHWADVEVDYDRVAYWYAKPGGTAPQPVQDNQRLWLAYIPKAAPVKGAVEGETAPILAKSGGETEVQDFPDLSRGKQVWWRDAQPGDRLVLQFEIPVDGEYEVSGNFCMAKDYGMHALSLGGQKIASVLDFYSPALEWKVVSFGKHHLKKGKIELVVESMGHRSEAEPRNMFALDYLIFKPASE